jgi:hypothetical protein
MAPTKPINFAKLSQLQNTEYGKELINYIQNEVNNVFLKMVALDDDQEIIKLNYRMKELTRILKLLTVKREGGDKEEN